MVCRCVCVCVCVRACVSMCVRACVNSVCVCVCSSVRRACRVSSAGVCVRARSACVCDLNFLAKRSTCITRLERPTTRHRSIYAKTKNATCAGIFKWSGGRGSWDPLRCQAEGLVPVIGTGQRHFRSRQSGVTVCLARIEIFRLTVPADAL